MDASDTERRKEEHIMRSLEGGSQYREGSGFERVKFLHNSLPEVDFDKIDTGVEAFGKKFGAPLMISGMTGGYAKAEGINKELACVAEEFSLAFGLGSQRAMLEKEELTKTYDVKKEAPSVFLIGNIGAYQLKEYSEERIAWMISKVELDALAIHLNPLQELIQPEGDRNWEGVKEAIGKHVESLDIPVIIKETGAGISPYVIDELKELGISWFDISGKGGTSWSKIEYMRGGSIEGFEEWGIATVDCLLMNRGKANIIASGGIRSGIDGAKAIALGAKFFGAAQPFLKAQQQGKLSETVGKWIEQLKGAMFLTGSKNIEELANAKLM
ncbi:MAG: type 2 isopentenyl-diphosphate Delta-isomerase [Methanobacteriota archaeon]|nr:MAG: type 2 isopentenyl-diphosphate Delta-isomerase [Euryarchaeota archaeon]